MSYQQLYLNGALAPQLSGPTDILGLSFAVDYLGNYDPTQSFASQFLSQYAVNLSEVAPGVSLASSIAGDVGISPGPVNTTLSFSAYDPSNPACSGLSPQYCLTLTFNNPLAYDPSTGNDLLLDVERTNPSSTDFNNYFTLAVDDTLSSAAIDNGSCAAGCVYDGQSSDANGNPLPQFGLVTDFLTAPVPQPPSSMPEPSTLGLWVLSTVSLLMLGKTQKRPALTRRSTGAADAAARQ